MVTDLNRLIEKYRGLIAEITAKTPLAARSGAVQGNSESASQNEPESQLEQEIDIDFILNDISDSVMDSLGGAERIRAIVADLYRLS